MRSGRKQAVMVALAALVTSLCPRAAQAQVLVTSDQNLTFGQVTPGVPVQIAPTDVTRRGALTVTGRGRFRITFTLPTDLMGPSGARIPVTFGATDGQVVLRNRTDTFDPRLGHEFRIVPPGDQAAQIYVGGRASPPAGATAGTYTATIVMMIVQTGT
jgi:hypothetical protein